MSLKEFTKEIFTRYGFTEDQINVYLVYLRIPRATPSQVYMTLTEDHEELTYEKILEVTSWLVENGFLKEIPGIVARYIPLEPYFELFTRESEKFREQIAEIKDNILADQASRFEKLEDIQNKSIGEVETAVDNQLKAFFEDSDSKNNVKKNQIEKARSRFTSTVKALESNLHAIMDTLNSDLDNISSKAVTDNETSINKTKDNFRKLLNDYMKKCNWILSNIE